MLLSRLFASAALVSPLVAALAVPYSHIVHEERTHDTGWIKRDRIQPHVKLPVRIGLAQSNLDKAHDFLMDISHPTSPNYGKHWTSEQVITAFEPSEETVSTVKEWLGAAGIKNITQSDNKIWLAFNASAHQGETLLHTEYHKFEHVTGAIQSACDRYHIPKSLQQHIDYITPGIKLLHVNTKGSNRSRKRQAPSQSSSQPCSKPSASTWTSGSSSRDDLRNCDSIITPACIAALYEIPPAPVDIEPISDNSMGIFESDLEYWVQEDLNAFFTNYTSIPNGTHPVCHSIDGGECETTNLTLVDKQPEANLDLSAAYPIVYPQSITIWSENAPNVVSDDEDGGHFGYNQLLDAIDGSYCSYSAYGETGDLRGVDPEYPDKGNGGYTGRLQCGVFKPTNVISISYSAPEIMVPIAYQKRQCNEFIKLGLQGVSFIFCSGDYGVGSLEDIYCPSGGAGTFSPFWPDSCPYVTSVGGVQLYPGHSVLDRPQPESAWFIADKNRSERNVGSGGGFSNIYPAPEYQKAALRTYFTDHDPNVPFYSAFANVSADDVYYKVNISALAGNTGGLYNRLGRGYPDVSANAYNLAIDSFGKFASEGGTSEAAPIFAAIINRINEERLRIGKSTLGFLNPSLYAYPEILTDVTNGSNKACANGKGFAAVRGWDSVTGLGTPNYPRMLEFYLGLP